MDRRNSTGLCSSSRSRSAKRQPLMLSAKMIPIAAAKARPAHARRARESRAMINKQIVEVAKDNQTALVIVARIASGTKARKGATGPRNFRVGEEHGRIQAG